MKFIVIIEVSMEIEADSKEKAKKIAHARVWDLLPDVDTTSMSDDPNCTWEITDKEQEADAYKFWSVECDT